MLVQSSARGKLHGADSDVVNNTTLLRQPATPSALHKLETAAVAGAARGNSKNVCWPNLQQGWGRSIVWGHWGYGQARAVCNVGGKMRAPNRQGQPRQTAARAAAKIEVGHWLTVRHASSAVRQPLTRSTASCTAGSSIVSIMGWSGRHNFMPYDAGGGAA
jgi:transcription elongation factor